MKRYGLKTLILIVTVFAIAFPFGYRHFANDYAARGMTGQLRARHVPETGVRLFVLCDSRSREASVVVMERYAPENAPKALEPSFCDVDVSDSGTRLTINGTVVFPTNDLVAYFARSNESPTMVTLDRDEYNKLTDDGMMPCYSDLDVWDLCVKSSRN